MSVREKTVLVIAQSEDQYPVVLQPYRALELLNKECPAFEEDLEKCDESLRGLSKAAVAFAIGAVCNDLSEVVAFASIMMGGLTCRKLEEQEYEQKAHGTAKGQA